MYLRVISSSLGFPVSALAHDACLPRRRNVRSASECRSRNNAGARLCPPTMPYTRQSRLSYPAPVTARHMLVPTDYLPSPTWLLLRRWTSVSTTTRLLECFTSPSTKNLLLSLHGGTAFPANVGDSTLLRLAVLLINGPQGGGRSKCRRERIVKLQREVDRQKNCARCYLSTACQPGGVIVDGTKMLDTHRARTVNRGWRGRPPPPGRFHALIRRADPFLSTGESWVSRSGVPW